MKKQLLGWLGECENRRMRIDDDFYMSHSYDRVFKLKKGGGGVAVLKSDITMQMIKRATFFEVVGNGGGIVPYTPVIID